MAVRPEIAAAFRQQIRSCERLGSPFTAQVLGSVMEELERGGGLEALIGSWPGDPSRDVLPLRIAGALHALALSGAAPDLAAFYPPQGSGGESAALRAAIAAAVAAHRAHFSDFLASPPQTNEVARSAALLGGFLRVARRTGLPLRLLEIGASAGLNLLWDRYRYRLGDVLWGDPSSPVLISSSWSGPPPDLDASLQVASRAGCDRSPIDLADPAQRLRLRSYIWADQRDRLARLDLAIALARGAELQVEQADADEWVERQLAAPAHGVATVLYHSIVWQYLPREAQARIIAAVESAGRHAGPESPVAWLRLEPVAGRARPELSLTLWPGGENELLATGHWHGIAVEWTAA